MVSSQIHCIGIRCVNSIISVACMQVAHVPALQESSAAFGSLFRQARSIPGAYRAAGAM